MSEIHSISDALSQRSFRNLIGYGLFAICTIIPSISAWQSEDDTIQRPAAPAFQPRPSRPQFDRFGPQSRPQFQRSGGNSASIGQWLWWFARGFLAAVGTTIAMMILLPYSGCKRFALLFGTPTGFAAMIASALWLSGRTVVYRFEPGLVGILAAVPTGFLWIQCCKWSFERRFHRRQTSEPPLRRKKAEPYAIDDDDVIE